MIVCSFRLIQEQDSKIDESRLKIYTEASQLVKSCILCHLLIKQVFYTLTISEAGISGYTYQVGRCFYRLKNA